MHPDMVRRLGWDLEGYDIEIIVAPSLANIAGPRVHIRPVAGLPLLHVEQPAYRGAQRWAKDLLDRVGGLGLLLLFSPVLVALAIAIKLTSPGGVFFVQERVGRDGKTFGMIKFRSMVEGADAMLADLQPDTSNVVMFKMRDDPRVTRVGSLPAPLLPRRAAAAAQRRQGRHEPRGSATSAGVGGLRVRRRGPSTPARPPRHDRAVADLRALRPRLGGDDAP